MSIIDTLPQKYGVFWKHSGNTSIWQFDLLEMALHQMDENCNDWSGVVYLRTRADRWVYIWYLFGCISLC